jgi:hypothetical protein
LTYQSQEWVLKHIIDPFGPGTDDPEMTKLEVFLLQVMHHMMTPEQRQRFEEDFENDPELFETIIDHDDHLKVAQWMEETALRCIMLRLILSNQARPRWEDGDIAMELLDA